MHDLTQSVPEVVYRYDYGDGSLGYEVCRFAEKQFRIRRRDGQWGWGNVQRVPYHMPDLVRAANRGGTAIVVEGEKDADRLLAEMARWGPPGIAVTTSAAGASWDWPPGWETYFYGLRRCYFIADNDRPGRRAAYQRAEVVAGVVDEVRVVEALPHIGDGGDVSDYFDGDKGSVTGLLAAMETGHPVGREQRGFAGLIVRVDR